MVPQGHARRGNFTGVRRPGKKNGPAVFYENFQGEKTNELAGYCNPEPALVRSIEWEEGKKGGRGIERRLGEEGKRNAAPAIRLKASG